MNRLRVHDFDTPEFYARVRTQLLASHPQKFARFNPVARKKAMKAVRRRIPRIAGVADENFSPTPAKDESCAQAGGTSADNDGIIHLHQFTRDGSGFGGDRSGRGGSGTGSGGIGIGSGLGGLGGMGMGSSGSTINFSP